MSIFELVKIALDELYAEGLKVHGQKLDAMIAERCQYLADIYTSLNKPGQQPIDYQDPATRFAYVFKYVATHGDYIVQVLEKYRAHLGSAIFQNENLRVSCVGGGPGSDIIAILKYLDDYGKYEPVKKITCYLLDKQQAWADTWTELDDSLNINNVVLHANFQPLDVTQPASWQSQQKFLQADLFTMSYFVSEVRALDASGVVSQFWTKLFTEAKSGALFLYIDNGHNDFNTYFDNLWSAAGLQRIAGEDNSRWTPRHSEQATGLGQYLQKFGTHPKLQAWLSYRILRKP